MQKKVKEYSYRDYVFTATEKTLQWQKERYFFVLEMRDMLKPDKDAKGNDIQILDEKKWIEFIHTPENIKKIIDNLITGDDIDKIIIDVKTEEEYEDLMKLVNELVWDFFQKPKQKTKK